MWPTLPPVGGWWCCRGQTVWCLPVFFWLLLQLLLLILNVVIAASASSSSRGLTRFLGTPPPSRVSGRSAVAGGRGRGFEMGCFQKAGWAAGGGVLLWWVGEGGSTLTQIPASPNPCTPPPPACCVQRLSDLQHPRESAYSGCSWLARLLCQSPAIICCQADISAVLSAPHRTSPESSCSGFFVEGSTVEQLACNTGLLPGGDS